MRLVSSTVQLAVVITIKTIKCVKTGHFAKVSLYFMELLKKMYEYFPVQCGNVDDFGIVYRLVNNV